MSTYGYVRTLTAGAAVAPYTIVRAGGTDGTVVASAARTDTHLGVTGIEGADAAGDRLDVHLSGPAQVRAGGTLAAGQRFTADATGRAVGVSVGAAACLVVGIVFLPAAPNDIVPCLVSPSLHAPTT